MSNEFSHGGAPGEAAAPGVSKKPKKSRKTKVDSAGATSSDRGRQSQPASAGGAEDASGRNDRFPYPADAGDDREFSGEWDRSHDAGGGVFYQGLDIDAGAGMHPEVPLLLLVRRGSHVCSTTLIMNLAFRVHRLVLPVSTGS